MTLLSGRSEEVCVILQTHSYRLQNPLEVEGSHEPDGADDGVRLRTGAQEGVDEVVSGGEQRPQHLERLERDARALLQTTGGSHLPPLHVGEVLEDGERQHVSVHVVRQQVAHDVERALCRDRSQMRAAQHLAERLQHGKRVLLVAEEVPGDLRVRLVLQHLALRVGGDARVDALVEGGEEDENQLETRRVLWVRNRRETDIALVDELEERAVGEGGFERRLGSGSTRVVLGETVAQVGGGSGRTSRLDAALERVEREVVERGRRLVVEIVAIAVHDDQRVFLGGGFCARVGFRSSVGDGGLLSSFWVLGRRHGFRCGFGGLGKM